MNLVGGLTQGADRALYLNGESIIIVDPAYPTLAARVGPAAQTTQFAPIDSSTGSYLVGNPVQAASGLIYSAAQSGGPNGLGSVLPVNYGSAAPPPAILFFAPSSAPPQTVVTIWGSRFVGATSVLVGGKPVPFTVTASGFIQFVVTKNAVTGQSPSPLRTAQSPVRERSPSTNRGNAGGRLTVPRPPRPFPLAFPEDGYHECCGGQT